MNELHLVANDLRFRCLAAGPESGPLVLMMHGFPEGAESWISVMEALAEAGRYAVAPDLRGYGGTDCPEGEEAYRMPHLVADVDGLLDALGRDRCHLAGHDWGALVGWSFVSQRAERVITWSALSVGHPAAFAEAIRDDPDQQRRSSYVRLFRMPGKAEDVLGDDRFRRLRAMFGGLVPERVVDGYVRGLERRGRLTAALNYYRVNLAGEDQESVPMAPNPITVPSQLIWGDQDPAVGRVSVERTPAHVQAEYRLDVLEGAGHWLQFERPYEVSSLVLDWIASHQS
jgi:pimeloyl-ACP methyl ester carboxylesterase